MYLTVVRFIATEQRHLWTANDTIRILWFTFNFRRYLQEPKTLLKNWGLKSLNFVSLVSASVVTARVYLLITHVRRASAE